MNSIILNGPFFFSYRVCSEVFNLSKGHRMNHYSVISSVIDFCSKFNLSESVGK